MKKFVSKSFIRKYKTKQNKKTQKDDTITNSSLTLN